ncbi:hybrid sensor histidine kinase/response regulator [Paraburkholderia sp.]|uniref:hybrid sensor histidine kinase/response regulator n=1 Tax=Paraburkholderia sp. TaxID=1926495 RepID=UPI00238DEE20|nr:hybrid sensor histidine kinase/response regulator [Paraburkholderia sp.]MDE1184759.1 hybrid sensor histidine kinase/response regulator [Paraburkholderia sp.]
MDGGFDETTPMILVVDDTPANLGVVVDCLESHRLRVTIARDGAEALSRAALSQPDLILLDVMMPGIDGFETCRRLKAQDSTRDIPVIFMTSLTQTEEKVVGFQAGAVDYVTKPLQVEEVAARVNTHLKLRTLQKLQLTHNARLRDEIETRKRAEAELTEMMHSVRNVSNAIAHDLRTPLAELRSRLESLAVMRPAPEETFGEVEAALADVDRVIAIFNALLRLAEIDAGIRQAGFVDADIGDLVSDAGEFYLPVAELRGLSLSVACVGDLRRVADHLLIAQAVGNLIDNALKFTPPNGTIHVAAQRNADGSISISVSDNGPGIPERDRHKVTGRFYRGDASRGTPGVGLGLALVAAVATLHGGSVAFTDNQPGTTATLLLGATQGARVS